MWVAFPFFFLERKVKCDGIKPVCLNCQNANRECRAGHAFELSWPKPRSRRALEGPKGGQSYAESSERVYARLRRKARGRYYFVNVLSDHVAAHLLLPYVASSQGTSCGCGSGCLCIPCILGFLVLLVFILPPSTHTNSVGLGTGTRSILFEREYAEELFLSLLPKPAPSLYADVARLQSDGQGLMSYCTYTIKFVPAGGCSFRFVSNRLLQPCSFSVHTSSV